MDSITLMLIVVLIAVIFALVVAVFALLNSQKALKESRGEVIESIAKREIENYMLLNYNQRIRNMVHDEMVREQQKQNDVLNKEIANPVEPVSVASNKEILTEQTAPISEEEPEKKPDEILLPEPVTLYTGICKDGSFKHVTTVPDSKTIFTIFADSKDAVEGILDVDASAFDKIVLTPDYLQNACVYSGKGTQLKVNKTGIVFKDNGAWVIKEPIVAEFN